ncbi:MAG TPA: DUF721 domain-containing protein [Rhizomicrobium sp.]|jgi:hypothetical protein|nr:DUF721 domain-containing protein [Rhizomicrobium sp.]
MAQDTKTKPREPEAPPPRRNRSEPVARGAAGLSTNIFARAGFRDPTLVLRWPEIVSPEVARLCQPVKLSEGAAGGVLTLKTEPAAAVFLHHESRALLERINRWLGREAVVRLRFVQGPLAVRPKPLSLQPSAGEIQPDDPALAYEGPDGVRDALIRLARRRAARPRPD